MKRKLSLAGIGAMFILAAIYFFPFGQDMLILWLTDVTGSQVNAWSTMYIVCFALLFVGVMIGGARALGTNQLTGLLKLLKTKPLLFIGVLLVAYAIYLKYIGVW